MPLKVSRWVWILLLVCFGLRITLFTVFQPWTPRIENERVLQSDAHEYHQLATNLIENHRFAFGSTEKPNAIRTPLYPMFVAAIYSQFGYRPWVVMLIQVVIDTATCLLLLSSISRLFTRRVALIASFLYALDPFLILYSSTTLLSDSIFVCLLVVALWFMSLGRHGGISRQTAIAYALSSFFLGLATLTKPVSQYILPCFLIFFAVAYRKRPRMALTYSLLSSIVFGLVLSPWLLRNQNTFDHLSLSTSGSVNLLLLNVVPMQMSVRHEDYGTVKNALVAEAGSMIEAEGLHTEALDEFEVAQYWRRLAVKYIVSDPSAFATAYLRGICHSFFNLGTRVYAETLGFPTARFNLKAYANAAELMKAFLERREPVALLIGGVIISYMLVTYIGAIIGLVVSWKQVGDRPILLLSLLLTLYFVLLAGAGGLARFKLPSIPFYLIFTGIGLNYVAERLVLARRTRTPRIDAGLN